MNPQKRPFSAASRRIDVCVGGSEIAVTIDSDGTIRLLLDGAVRAMRRGESGRVANAYLTTTLQTDYEYHSLVEAHILAGGDDAHVRILLDGTEVANETVHLASSAAEPASTNGRDGGPP